MQMLSHSLELLLDSASVDDLEQALAPGFVQGVTTNPSLIAREDGFFSLSNLWAASDPLPVYLQLTELESRSALRQILSLHRLAPTRVVIKIPCLPHLLDVIASCRDAGLSVCATAFFRRPRR